MSILGLILIGVAIVSGLVFCVILIHATVTSKCKDGMLFCNCGAVEEWLNEQRAAFDKREAS